MDQKALLDRELISALADGHLRGDEFARAMACVDASEEGRATWHAYHLVGDVLRSADLGIGGDDRAFVERLRARLEGAEGVGGAGGASEFPRAGSQVVRPDAGVVANDPDVRWKWLAGFASIVAVAALGWQLNGVDAGSGAAAGSRLAALPAAPAVVSGSATQPAASVATATATAAPPPEVMLRDPRLDELLAAHKQLGGTSALQMPAGFLRNATFENPGR